VLKHEPHRHREAPKGRGIPAQGATLGTGFSAGGHRRVSRAAVLDWKAKHQVTGKATDLRTEGEKAGAHKSTEADVMRRVKALAKSR